MLGIGKGREKVGADWWYYQYYCRCLPALKTGRWNGVMWGKSGVLSLQTSSLFRKIRAVFLVITKICFVSSLPLLIAGV